MPMIDAREIFNRVRDNQTKRSLRKIPPRRKGEKPLPKAHHCRRDGCNNEDVYGYGLCKKCYDMLKKVPKEEDKDGDRYGQRDPIFKEFHVKVGDTILISQGYPSPAYRGLFAKVVRVEDEGAVLLIEITGDSIEENVSPKVRAMEGNRIHICVHWCLPVEE